MAIGKIETKRYFRLYEKEQPKDDKEIEKEEDKKSDKKDKDMKSSEKEKKEEQVELEITADNIPENTDEVVTEPSVEPTLEEDNKEEGYERYVSIFEGRKPCKKEEIKEAYQTPEDAVLVLNQNKDNTFSKQVVDFLKKASSKIVKVKLSQFQLHEKGGLATFYIYLDFGNLDKYIDSKTYESGNAYIYVKDDYRNFLANLSKQTFNEIPAWNNTRSTFSIFHYL